MTTRNGQVKLTIIVDPELRKVFKSRAALAGMSHGEYLKALMDAAPRGSAQKQG